MQFAIIYIFLGNFYWCAQGLGLKMFYLHFISIIYCGSHFYWWWELKNPEKMTELPKATYCRCRCKSNHIAIMTTTTPQIYSTVLTRCFCQEGRVVVFNATFNNISVISWQLVLLVVETGVPRKNHWPAASYWQTLSHNVVLSTPRNERDSNSLRLLFFFQIWPLYLLSFLSIPIKYTGCNLPVFHPNSQGVNYSTTM